MTPDELAEWVAASCVLHGVPVKVADVGVLGHVAALWSGGASGPGRGAPAPRTDRRPGASHPPVNVHPLGVQRAGATLSGADLDSVDQGGDDGVLSGQREIGPLGA